jgi:outer membrane protein assembly factor BamD
MRQDLSDRDQKAAKESFEAFRELLNRFPNSRYSDDARQRMAQTINTLAESEIKVASYYYKRGAYVAAMNRAQTAVKDFPDVPSTQQALEILVNCYEKLGLNQLRDDTQRVLKTNFPSSTLGISAPKKDSWWKLW